MTTVFGAVAHRVERVIMEQWSAGRAVELPKATEEERKAMSRVVSAIMAARVMSFEKAYAEAIGSMEGFGLEDRKNFGKGSIAQWKAAKFFRWIVENHLALAADIASEVFDPSLLTRWRDFVRRHGTYDKLSFRFTDGMGLTQRSRNVPIADIAIPMGRPYAFDLNCGVSGQLLTLEMHEGKTYPFAMHHDEVSLLLNVAAGQQTLPRNADGSPGSFAETENSGLRCYMFLVTDTETMQSVIKGLGNGHPIKPEKLDQIAKEFVDSEGQPVRKFELHRLNVIFK